MILQVVKDNIWNFLGHGFWVVIPTNGQTNQRDFAVMGRGLALQATRKFPNLSTLLGRRLIEHGNYIHIFPEYALITFPVKEHWCNKASIALIERSMSDLEKLARNIQFGSIAMPKVGCGNGGLKWTRVKPIIEDYVEEISPFTNIVIVDKT